MIAVLTVPIRDVHSCIIQRIHSKLCKNKIYELQLCVAHKSHIYMCPSRLLYYLSECGCIKSLFPPSEYNSFIYILDLGYSLVCDEIRQSSVSVVCAHFAGLDARRHNGDRTVPLTTRRFGLHRVLLAQYVSYWHSMCPEAIDEY
jgi:hypothetical protein